LLPLYLVIFIGFCGYSLMITLFVPMLMGTKGFLAADATTGQRSVVLGILLAIYPLGQFLGSPVLGALSDRYGRKPVLTVSLCIAVAAYVLISLGIELGSLALIAIGCLIGGLAESNIAIAQSAISDVAGPDERPRLFAWIYSCCSLGYIAGPVIGGQLPMICVTLPDLISANTILDEGSSIIMAGEIAGLKVDEDGLLGVERAQRLVSPCQPMTRA
jgi:MFS family permease